MEEVGWQAIGYIKGYAATKTKLLKLLPEIVEVVDLAIRTADRRLETDDTTSVPIYSCLT